MDIPDRLPIPLKSAMGRPPSEAQRLIAKLGLAPHPEGGWFREVWRAPVSDGKRADATSIHFLLETGQRSHWHKVDATEIWLWHGGDRLRLSLSASEAGPERIVTLGPAVLEDEQPQVIIAPGEWQAAEPLAGPAGYCLVSCIVSPGFEFAGFELAPAGWTPGAAR